MNEPVAQSAPLKEEEVRASVTRAMNAYYPNGGDDWGYVSNRKGKRVSRHMASWDEAVKASQRLNTEAVIRALRAPTPGMLHAGFGTADADNAWRWEAMIDALLQESEANGSPTPDIETAGGNRI